MEDDVQLERVRTMGPDEFARWVEERPSSDVNHYELLNGRATCVLARSGRSTTPAKASACRRETGFEADVSPLVGGGEVGVPSKP